MALRIPAKKKYLALYSKKVLWEAWHRIDFIHKKLDVPKWQVINTIVCAALGIKNDKALDIKKYLKGCK